MHAGSPADALVLRPRTSEKNFHTWPATQLENTTGTHKIEQQKNPGPQVGRVWRPRYGGGSKNSEGSIEGRTERERERERAGVYIVTLGLPPAQVTLEQAKESGPVWRAWPESPSSSFVGAWGEELEVLPTRKPAEVERTRCIDLRRSLLGTPG